jgi:hypothetical protein
MKTRFIKSVECSTVKMVAGNERKFTAVVHNGYVKHWVGFTWLCDRTAVRSDYKKFPVVKG